MNSLSERPAEAVAAQRNELRRAKLVLSATAGAGGILAILCLGSLAGLTELPALIAPFGATSALLFALPASPLAQPRNVIGGHTIAAASGLAMFSIFGPGLLTAAFGVGLAIFLMIQTETMHPPAGANPVVIAALGTATWSFLLAPILLGTLILVAIAVAFHHFLSGQRYPARPFGQ